MFRMIGLKAQPASRCKRCTVTASLVLLALMASGTPLVAAAADGSGSSLTRYRTDAAQASVTPGAATQAERPAPLRMAQAAPQPASGTTARVAAVAPGDSLALPNAIVSQASATQNYVIITKAPSWLDLRTAERVGDGVWLVSPQNVETARMNVTAGATGEREIVITIVEKAGAPIGEARLKLQVVAKAPAPIAAARQGKSTAPAIGAAQAQTAPAPQAAAPAAATAATPPRPAAPPAATAAPAAPATNAATAAAPAGQNTTKTWTDFIAGKKPPTAVKPTAPAAAGTGQMSEADMIPLAKHLVRECTTCHSLYGEDNGIPLMIGLTRDRFLDTMDLYKSGKRDNVAMQSVAQSLSDEETLALAMYLGRIKAPAQMAARGPGGAAGGGVSDASPAQTLRVPAARLDAGSAQAKRVNRWIERAQQMMQRGEIAQARLLLQRGAELGHALATLTLASTYDPNILPWRPDMGPEAEPARARALYQQAIQLGAGGEAERRLMELP